MLTVFISSYPRAKSSHFFGKWPVPFFAYCGWRGSCAHVMYSPVSLLRTKHAVAWCTSMCAASAVVCERVRDAIGLVAVYDGFAFLGLVLCSTCSCTCRCSWRAPLLMVPCGEPLVIVPGWAPLEVTVGACRSWCGSVFDCWLLCGVPCGFCCNCSLVDFRGGISLYCGVTRHVLKMFLSYIMAASCDAVLLIFTSWIAHVRRCTACTMWSSGVILGCLRYVWRKSTVSDMLTCFVLLSNTVRRW